jgi:hypothetical protein
MAVVPYISYACLNTKADATIDNNIAKSAPKSHKLWYPNAVCRAGGRICRSSLVGGRDL